MWVRPAYAGRVNANILADPTPAIAPSSIDVSDLTVETTTSDSLLESSLTALIIIVAALLLILLGRWLLARLFRRLALVKLPDLAPEVDGAVRVTGEQRERERERRLKTLHGLCNSVLTVTITAIAVIMVLQVFGIAVGPLLASVGIVGVALAFGAKSLVEDVVAGLFMLLENQYNVGDRIEVGGTVAIMSTGTVVEVGLRVTTLRDDTGKLWYVRNGQILRVSNESQGSALTTVDLTLAPGTDVSAVRRQIEEFLRTAVAEDDVAALVMPEDQPRVLLSDLSAQGATIQIQAHARPGHADELASVLRRWLYREIDKTGIELA